MVYILDASAGIEIALDKTDANKFKSKLDFASKVVTTELYKAETANVLWKYFKAGYLTKEESLRSLKFCDALIDEYVDISSNNEESLVESMRLNHSTYDLLYLTLARRRGAILVSMDKKLKKLAIENGVEVLE